MTCGQIHGCCTDGDNERIAALEDALERIAAWPRNQTLPTVVDIARHALTRSQQIEDVNCAACGEPILGVRRHEEVMGILRDLTGLFKRSVEQQEQMSALLAESFESALDEKEQV